MANVSGGNPTNRVYVSNTKAEYYSGLTETYMNKTKEYMEICLLNANRLQTQYEEITLILADLPTQKQTILDEIINTANDKIEDIQEATDEYKTQALNEIGLEIVKAQDFSKLSEKWANFTDDTVDGVEYSSKYYALLAKTEHTQALSELTSSLASAKTEIGAVKTGAIADIETIGQNTYDTVTGAGENALTDISEAKTNAENELTSQFNTYSSILDNEMDAFLKDNDRLHEGVDLEIKFADEIAEAGNVYTWLENRKNAGNFEGIHIGDYFHTSILAGTVAGYSIPAQNFLCRIVGINTYKNCGDTPIGDMFYIISDQVIDTPIKWNPADNNNGTSNRNNPWLASAIYAVLNGVNNYDNTSGYNKVVHGANASGKGILQLLPKDLQNVIKQKRGLLDKRYSASGLLTGGTNWAWEDMGKLWLPNEIEVYGCGIRSNLCQTAGFWFPEAGLSIQFPWFANNCGHRIKKRSDGARCGWWLSSVAGNTSGYACHVNSNGNADSHACTYATIYAPLCFCI